MRLDERRAATILSCVQVFAAACTTPGGVSAATGQPVAEQLDS